MGQHSADPPSKPIAQAPLRRLESRSSRALCGASHQRKAPQLSIISLEVQASRKAKPASSSGSGWGKQTATVYQQQQGGQRIQKISSKQASGSLGHRSREAKHASSSGSGWGKQTAIVYQQRQEGQRMQKSTASKHRLPMAAGSPRGNGLQARWLSTRRFRATLLAKARF